MKKFIRTILAWSVFSLAFRPVFIPGGNAVSAQSANDAGDYVLTFARVFVPAAKEIQVDEKANIVRETLLFHGDGNAPDKVTGKCVLEYAWSEPPGRFASTALDQLAAKSVISAAEASGEWTVRPKSVDLNLFFFKTGDKDTLASVMAGKWADLSPYELFKLKSMSLLPDQSSSIEEFVSNQNQAKWLPFARAWKGQTMKFTPADYPQAVLIVKVKGLFVDGYACYGYEYDPQGKKSPIRKE